MPALLPASGPCASWDLITESSSTTPFAIYAIPSVDGPRGIQNPTFYKRVKLTSAGVAAVQAALDGAGCLGYRVQVDRVIAPATDAASQATIANALAGVLANTANSVAA